MAHAHLITAAHHASQRGWLRRFACFACATALFLVPGRGVAGMAAGGIQSPAGAAAASYRLTVTRDGALLVSLESNDARLGDVAADLARQVGIPIVVSPAIAGELLSVGFEQLPFEAALGALALRAYVDYELRPGEEAVPVGAHLVGFDELAPPPRHPAVGVLIEGHTEEVADPSADGPLRLSFDNNRLSIVADRQPLAVVVAAAAEMLSVPYGIEYPATEIVNVALVNAFPETALLRLAPGIRVDVRADLYRGDRTVQRVVLERPRAR